MADNLLYEGDAIAVDARVAVGVGVLVIKTDEGRIVVSTTQEALRELVLRISLELDSSPPRPTRQAPANGGSAFVATDERR